MTEEQPAATRYRRAFDNKEDFMKYYEEHKEEIDKLTTKQLNSVYKINECKISRNKNKIIVRSNSPKTKEKKDKVKPTDLNKIIDHLINEFEKQLSELRELKNKIVSNELYESEKSETKNE